MTRGEAPFPELWSYWFSKSLPFYKLNLMSIDPSKSKSLFEWMAQFTLCGRSNLGVGEEGIPG